MRFLLCLLFITSCHHSAAAPANMPPLDSHAAYESAVNRLGDFQEPSGWVISRGAGSTNQGDSLIFSGIAMASLSCAAGAPIANAMEAMLTPSGEAYRHPSLKGQISIDGLLGLYRGIDYRTSACGEKARWAAAMAKHKIWSQVHAILGPLDVVRDQLLYKLGIEGKPDVSRMFALSVVMTDWAVADLIAKAPCYRLNLALLALQTSGADNSAFCFATKPAGIALIDQACGREGLKAFLDGFQENVWQYKHQRCQDYEKPDGDGQQQPGVDLLAGWTAFYGNP